MTQDHMGTLRPTLGPKNRAWATWRVIQARGAVFGAVLTLLLGSPGAEAASGRPRPGWSSAPRWRLPRARPPECPNGYERERGRPLVQVRKARCLETGPERQVAKASPPRPAARLPSVYDEPDAPPREPAVARPAPVQRAPARPAAIGRIPTLAPGPDATALMRMDAAACRAHLDAHEVPYVAVDRRQAPEVAIPVRLTGAVAGVDFTIPWSDDLGRDPHAIWDCRLVAAIVPMAEYLRAHGVTEVQYFSALRRGKIVRNKPHSQHNVGLALDLLGVRGPDMPLAKVEQVYPRGRLRGCPADSAPGSLGAAAPIGAAPADLYFALVCQAQARGLFHTILTPDHDRAHHNHLHLDLKAGQASPADPFVSFDE